MSNISKFTRLISQQKESGLSVKMFCVNEGIAESTFYYWQKRIRNEVGEKRFIPLVVNTAGTNLQKLAQTETYHPQRYSDNQFEIIYPNGIILRIKADQDLAGLRALISLMD
jgi:hypothetical protein